MASASAARPVAPLGVVALALGGCGGDQSVLTAAGPEAERVALLFWIMIGGGTALLALVVALTVLAFVGPAWWRTMLASESAVVAGGIALPVVVLTALLTYGLLVMRANGQAPADGEPLRISVIAEQWWWRIIYHEAAGAPRFETANELRIPVGRTVELTLSSADVIHSFWVPNLAGKLDMIPGRQNVLRLAASAPGTSRGQCAEYCGGAHAMMSFHVVSVTADAFARWLSQQAEAAAPPAGAPDSEGQRLFHGSGCGACHAIRGTPASGTIGPDLTHVGSRLWIAAGTLPNTEAALARWVRDNQHIKPENRMVPYRIFADDELAALARYLAGLR